MAELRVAFILEHVGIDEMGLALSLRIAEELAAKHMGILIRDRNLVRAVALPFTLEIGWPTYETRPLNKEQFLRQLDARLARLTREFEKRVEATGTEPALEVVHGPGLQPIFTPKPVAELMLLGTQRRRAVATNLIDPILFVQSADAVRNGSDGGIERRVIRALNPAAEVIRIPWSGVGALRNAIRHIAPGLLVVPNGLLTDVELEALRTRWPCPILVVAAP